MKRVVLLKTQLVEAAKLAVCNDFSKQRLAVIFLTTLSKYSFLR